jgi:SAM-dependent methyltransferase
MSASGWWDGFFTGLMAEMWRIAIPPEVTRAEVDFFERALRLSRGARVLDVPCGHGRHSVELARRGYRVTGVDFSVDLLSAARGSAAREGLAIEWVECDMRQLSWEGRFDAAFCAGNSFGYFDDEGNLSFLQGAARALGPGGRFLLDSGWVAESLFPSFHEKLDMDFSGLRFQVENRYDPAEAVVRNVFTASRDGRTETRPAAHRVYTYREVAEMMKAIGLRELEAFGSTDGSPFSLGSPRLLLAATRA